MDIDLDRKLFSVGSHDCRGHHHLKLDDIPEDWIELSERARTKKKIVLNQAAASYPKPEPDQSLYKRSNLTIFQISLASSFIREPTYMSLVDCLTAQMSGYGSYDYFKFLDEWGPKRSPVQEARIYDSPSIQQLRSHPPPHSGSTASTSSSKPTLDHSWSSQNLKAAVTKVTREKQRRSARTRFTTALLFSVRHVVVVEVGSDGGCKIHSTDPGPAEAG